MMLWIPGVCLVVVAFTRSPEWNTKSSVLRLKSHTESSTSEILSKAYDDNGIRGVLEWRESPSLNQNNDNAPRLVQAALDASGSNKGKAAGILNALIGSCCTFQRADFALELLQAYDDSSLLKPDVVTLSLAYTAAVDQYPDIAANVLERAVRLVPRTKLPTSQLQSKSFDWKEQMVKKYGVQVLHDNDELAILNKPSGMELFECVNPTRRLTKTAAPSLEALLLKQGMELSSLNPDGSRGFVHRLDVGTSGCLVVAKTASSSCAKSRNPTSLWSQLLRHAKADTEGFQTMVLSI
jgi:hypothetical protein